VREAKSLQFAEVSAQLSLLDARFVHTPEVSRIVEKSNDSPAAQQLRGEIGVLEKDLALERAIKTEQHPRVQELKAKLDSTQQRLRQEEGRLVERIKLVPNAEYMTLKQQRDDLRGQREGLSASIGYLDHTVQSLRQEMASYSGNDLQLATLMQRFTMADQRYTSILARLRQAETNVDSIRRSSAIAIVDTSGPLNPAVDVSKGRAKKLTLLAFVLSATMGVFILAAWDYLDRRVRTTADTEALVELPVAGIIPRALPRAASQPLSRLAALMPASPEGEAYRFLSLHLLLSREDNPVRVLMMATAKPGQGATTTISNLAATLAQANRRVILVDADLRRPSLHNLFETSNEVGLTSVLAEGLPIERALQPTLLPNLALLPGGPMSENPWVLLRSPAMEQLVQRLRGLADFVLIDTPSAAAFADAFNVAPLADGVFMVVRSRHQPTGIELKIKRMFEEAGVKVFGAILNDVPMQNVESCRYHQDYYGPSSRARHAEPPALTAGRS
jgi:capsular exopolysaccharide synthesis family protein